MKKLASKVFWTICIILTCFLISILSIFNYQDYSSEEESIKSNLTKINSSTSNNIGSSQSKDNILEEPKDDDGYKDDLSQKIYMDITVYTVLLNDDDEIIDVISHNEKNTNDDEIIAAATEILNSDNLQEISISNLYFSDYSYAYHEHNFLTIVDNAKTKEKLFSTLKNSIIIFIVLEIVIVYLSKIVTSWIIKPVELSFNKQKQFIADASHELKTPLAVIMASSEALENNPTEKKWLSNIKNETERMSKLVSDLLDLARLEQGVNTKCYSKVNLSKIVEMQTLTFEGLAFEENLALKYEIEKNINFVCDSNQMKQVVSILLDNAIKHSEKKGTINIHLWKEKNEIILTVTNKGSTIPKEEQEKIFERFYRGDKARNRNDNRYGLGLSILKNIVVNHGGKVTVNSQNNHTTFKVVFKEK